MEKQDKYARFNHSPIRAVRQGITGEIVFANAWERLLSTPAPEGKPALLLRVLETFRHAPTEQDARVLASVVTWFGTGQGKLFLDSVAGDTDPDRFLKAWGAKNKSVPWVNNGLRALESILYGEAGGKMTLRQSDAVECLMSWLGRSAQATQFIEECELALQRHDREDMLIHHLKANCHLSDGQVSQVLHLAHRLA